MHPAIDGETWAEWISSIQNAGVDSLEFSFDIEIRQAMWERLEEEKALAQLLLQTRKAEHVPDWLNAVVHPMGAKGGYRFLLETPIFSIKLLKGVPNRPPIYVEMRAFGPHTHEGGAIGACKTVCAFIRETLLADEDPEWTATVINLMWPAAPGWTNSWTGRGAQYATFAVNDETAFIKRVHAESGATYSRVRSMATKSASRRSWPHLRQDGAVHEEACRVVSHAPPGAQWYALRRRQRPLARGVPAAPRRGQRLPPLCQARDERSRPRH
ncbi:MAG TPA: hypothetical protein VGP82_22570 [Ktedonobacterales bacterium]|nr:hypothetical protein [Ktedonobacterales bacterium]